MNIYQCSHAPVHKASHFARVHCKLFPEKMLENMFDLNEMGNVWGLHAVFGVSACHRLISSTLAWVPIVHGPIGRESGCSGSRGENRVRDQPLVQHGSLGMRHSVCAAFTDPLPWQLGWLQVYATYVPLFIYHCTYVCAAFNCVCATYWVDVFRGNLVIVYVPLLKEPCLMFLLAWYNRRGWPL